jgi:hypothetical protein
MGVILLSILLMRDHIHLLYKAVSVLVLTTLATRLDGGNVGGNFGPYAP